MVHFLHSFPDTLNSLCPCPSVLRFEIIPATNVSAVFPAPLTESGGNLIKSQLSSMPNPSPSISLKPSLLTGYPSLFPSWISLLFSKLIIANILFFHKVLTLFSPPSLLVDNFTNYFTQKIEAITEIPSMSNPKIACVSTPILASLRLPASDYFLYLAAGILSSVVPISCFSLSQIFLASFSLVAYFHQHLNMFIKKKNHPLYSITSFS